jgi:CRISPR-associated exonuclease Cas4
MGDAMEPEQNLLIPLSALQHHLYCPRQCALIHVEQVWSENALTAEGRLLHERTAEAGAESRRGVRTVTAMPIASRQLGVSGIADVVEMHKDEAGRWRPYPVEYKRGRPKAHRADEVQLCAQAMALEEMVGVDIAEGALFYGQPRRRTAVGFDAELRRLTEEIASAARAMIAAGVTPPAVFEKRKCGACSLIGLCRPKHVGQTRSASAWLARRLAEA